ncbi:unnamed protein product [Rhodiola kirilowii]
MMIGWILHTVDSSIQTSLSYCDSVKVLWDEIQQRFSIGNAPRIHQLRTKISHCRQNGQDISVYFGRLKHLQYELSTYIKPRYCTCAGCKCAWVSELQVERREEAVHQFLMGLDDAYGTLRFQILAQDPLPELNRVYYLVVQEERHRTISTERTSTQDDVAFAAQGKHFSTKSHHAGQSETSNKIGKASCSHCGRPNHDVSSCFKLHGYPEWWEELRRKRSGNQPPSSGARRGRGASEHNREALTPSLTDAQWNQMMDMMKNFKSTSDQKMMGKRSGSWILDTGASYHMTGDSNLLENLHAITPSTITLPDGSSLVASQAGTAVLGDSLRISNVLLVPEFNCNLISLVHLIHELRLLVTLTDKFCVIQDRTLRTVIGVGEQGMGSYGFALEIQQLDKWLPFQYRLQNYGTNVWVTLVIK